MVHDSVHCFTSGVALLVDEVSSHDTSQVSAQSRVDCIIAFNRIIEGKFRIENVITLTGEHIAHNLVSRSVHNSNSKRVLEQLRILDDRLPTSHACTRFFRPLLAAVVIWSKLSIDEESVRFLLFYHFNLQIFFSR